MVVKRDDVRMVAAACVREVRWREKSDSVVKKEN